MPSIFRNKIKLAMKHIVPGAIIKNDHCEQYEIVISHPHMLELCQKTHEVFDYLPATGPKMEIPAGSRILTMRCQLAINPSISISTPSFWFGSLKQSELKAIIEIVKKNRGYYYPKVLDFKLLKKGSLLIAREQKGGKETTLVLADLPTDLEGSLQIPVLEVEHDERGAFRLLSGRHILSIGANDQIPNTSLFKAPPIFFDGGKVVESIAFPF